MPDPRSGTASIAIEAVEAARRTGEVQRIIAAGGAQVVAEPRSDGSIAWTVTNPKGRLQHRGVVPARMPHAQRCSSVSLLSILTRLDLLARRRNQRSPP
jgi:hypothetical protein